MFMENKISNQFNRGKKHSRQETSCLFAKRDEVKFGTRAYKCNQWLERDMNPQKLYANQLALPPGYGLFGKS